MNTSYRWYKCEIEFMFNVKLRMFNYINIINCNLIDDLKL